MFTSAQLAAEINTDPKSLGYAALKASGDDYSLAALINKTYAGVGVVWRSSVPAQELLSQIIWTDVSAFSAAQWEALSVMLIPLKVDTSSVNVRNFFGGLFAGKTTTLNGLTAISQVVAPSRAQELWGDTATVSPTDVQHAMGR